MARPGAAFVDRAMTGQRRPRRARVITSFCMMSSYRKCRAMRLQIAAILLIGLIFFLSPYETGYAQDDDRVVVDVGDCADIESRRERLECLDERLNAELAAREASAENSGSVSNAPRDGARGQSDEPTAADDAEFVSVSELPADAPIDNPSEPPLDSREYRRQQRELRREERLRAQEEARAERERERENRETSAEIVAIVTDLREIEPDAWIVTLDNGQVWRQNQPKRYRLMTGAEVQISPTRWGPSYRLVDPNLGSYIQVERIQ